MTSLLSTQLDGVGALRAVDPRAVLGMASQVGGRCRQWRWGSRWPGGSARGSSWWATSSRWRDGFASRRRLTGSTSRQARRAGGCGGKHLGVVRGWWMDSRDGCSPASMRDPTSSSPRSPPRRPARSPHSRPTSTASGSSARGVSNPRRAPSNEPWSRTRPSGWRTTGSRSPPGGPTTPRRSTLPRRSRCATGPDYRSAIGASFRPGKPSSAATPFEAERTYRQIVELEPENVEAWLQLGEVRFHSGPRRGLSHGGGPARLRAGALLRARAHQRHPAPGAHRGQPGEPASVSTPWSGGP